ncbi:hypothetical protein I2494_03515 [Budviciaceae bacterium BWR-B9]|uniref:Uncharacterized protein n=1 Tax=Limnobaculum allomyrinae TaxID=2791986 RepID=A0ABS1IM40_9GAMM|nr:hypothetical protein [Limnobaculum sp. M2-1]MBK5142798.1 hypothetical protein [Limnobaculum allomyrinae]MBV7690315.1 hypothetical protein [Limnobaculum sp. M2-1]
MEKTQEINHQERFIQHHFYQNLHHLALQAALRGMDDVSSSKVVLQKKFRGRMVKR